jgi:hypothetical protein
MGDRKLTIPQKKWRGPSGDGEGGVVASAASLSEWLDFSPIETRNKGTDTSIKENEAFLLVHGEGIRRYYVGCCAVATHDSVQ